MPVQDYECSASGGAPSIGLNSYYKCLWQPESQLQSGSRLSWANSFYNTHNQLETHHFEMKLSSLGVFNEDGFQEDVCLSAKYLI